MTIMRTDYRFRKGQTNPAGYQICGGEQPDGSPCPSTVLESNGRCMVHQAMELGPIIDYELLSRYGPDLPKDVLGRVRRALEDQELLDMRENIRLFDARIGELLAQLQDGYVGDFPTLGEALRNYERTRDDPDSTQLAKDEAWQKVQEMMESSERRTSVWNHIERATNQRLRLVERQQKREEYLEQNIPLNRLMVLVDAINTLLYQQAKDMLGERKGSKFAAAIQEQWSMLLQTGGDNA